VDVGHYHAEPGVISASGIPEFEFNLKLANEVRQNLETSGLQVRMIGDQGNLIFLNHRTRAAAGADLFVSRNNPHADKSLACASAIGAQMRAAGFTPSRYHADPVIGENRPFADEPNGVHFYDNLAVGKTAAMPSVLVEAGVIVNRHEEQRMLDPAVRARIARAVALGVAACLR